MSELNDLLDLFDLALGRSEGVLDDELLDRAGSLRRRLRVRDHFVEDVLTVAFAGGTGTGKSSLVNAVAGGTAVVPGVLRPTTQSSTAVVPGRLTASIGPLLEAVGVDEVSNVYGPEDRLLVDLPDHDSIELAHREVVERVLPNVDVVSWVADPEKYADPTVMQQFLEPMLPFEDQFVFVLNKSDLVAGSAHVLAEHLRSILTGIGYRSPRVVSTAASPPEDAPPDIEELADALTNTFDTKRTALAKVAIDIRLFANEAWAAARSVAVDSGSADSALAASTFVSLGVAGYEMYARVTTRAIKGREIETC